MTSEKNLASDADVKLAAIASIGHEAHPLSIEDHEIDLSAVISKPISLSDVAVDLTSDEKFFVLKRLNYEFLVSLDDLPVGATFMLEKISHLSIEESLSILQEYLSEHEDDVNIPTKDYELNRKLVEVAPFHMQGTIKEKLSDNLGHKGGDTHVYSEADSSNSEDPFSNEDIYNWNLQVRLEAALIAYHSPYPEVRSVTDPYDDPSIPCETVRVYIIGLVWTAVGTFVNQFFAQRMPSISFTTSVAQLFMYPSGLLLEAILPKWKFKIWRYEIDLNPGPWNHKEQMLATIFFSVAGGGTSYVTYNIHVQKLKMFYNNQWADFGYQTLLILSTNFMGFGFAGIMRKFAVYPIKSIWPSILPTLALNRALLKPERKENIHGWTISRYAWFWLVAAGSFLYFWIPDYLMGFVSTFNWMTWIKPDNFNLAAITGSVSGLGVNPIPTFDWNVLDFNGALTIPFYSQVNQYIGSLIGLICIVGVYWSNYKWSGYLPINSNSLFTNTGDYYSVTEILNEHSLIDKAKYEKYGPPFYTAANLVVYGAFFALYPFAIFYEIFTNYKPMVRAIKEIYHGFRSLTLSTYDGFKDPHSRMMLHYKEVPEWCFTCVLVISIVLAIICVEIYPAETPVWGIFFAVGINFVFLIPITAIYSVTGFSFGLNVLVELIVGYALPGNGLALNFIKALGYNIDGQAQNFITDQKMGHYAKIPQRAMFRCQMLAVFVSSFIALGVMSFQFTSIKDYCHPDQSQKFTCPDIKTFYSASILWGVIGPKKVFGGLYPILQWCFLIGFLLAFPCAIWKKWGPKKYTKYFQPALIIGGILIYAPYNLSYYTGGLYLSFASMWYLRNNYLAWWEKYNYVFSSGMSAGVAFSSIIIFFAVQYHDKSISWWGNNVMYLGMDGAGPARLNAAVDAPDGYFGPRFGHFP